MNMEFYRKLPIPKEVKEMMPLCDEAKATLDRRKEEIKDVISGKSDKFLLIIGPCSADREDAVLDYLCRLKKAEERVKDKIVILPRVYTNKPRSRGDGYMGMLHQPDPSGKPDLLKGILAIRQMHIRAITESGFGCADEMLYPENHRYISDLLAYVSVGARSVENQQHRLTASGLDIPVGMKNPTGGSTDVLINSVRAARAEHMFLYRGWEVKTHGNPYAHAILRGYVKNDGSVRSNYGYDHLMNFYDECRSAGLNDCPVIVDTNHANSGKNYLSQINIAKDVMQSRRASSEIRSAVRGLMIESYIEDGAQEICENAVYGRSVTDPCLGWEKSERLIYDIAEML